MVVLFPWEELPTANSHVPSVSAKNTGVGTTAWTVVTGPGRKGVGVPGRPAWGQLLISGEGPVEWPRRL